MKPQIQGDIQTLPLGSRAITAIQGRPLATTAPSPGQAYVWNGTAWSTQGPSIAHGKATSNVTSTGTTFAGGTDVLASALKFTADGKSDYLLSIWAPFWSNSTTAQNQLRINLDGSDVGNMAALQVGTAIPVPLSASGVIVSPSSGKHTVNARLMVASASTATIGCGAGGAGVNTPLLVALFII